MRRPQSSHSTALVCYVGACSLSLLFCLSKSQTAAGAEAAASGLLDEAFPGGVDQAEVVPMHRVLSSSDSGLLDVLESLLQTQLGVFVFANFVIACCAAVAAVTTSVFLDSLTPSEAGRLTQRLLKYLLFKVALVGMVVLPNEVQLVHWLPWLAVIGEMKMFVGLAKDRLAGLSVTPTVGLSRHMRTLCLLGFILCSNVLGLALLHRHTGALSWAVSLLFALDLGIISVEATKAALSCVSLLMDEAVAVSTPSLHVPVTFSGRAMAFWDSWQGKGRERFFYQTELVADVAVHLLTLLHHIHVWLLHGMSFHLLDALLLLDTRMVVVSFVQRVKAHMLHRAATHSLDFTFPDATDKLLMADDAECAICRDKLSAAKQLPCGHLFHLPCLRAWLQQSGHENFKCPICRRALCVQRSNLPGGANGAHGAAGPAQQRWRVAGQGPAGLMGSLSLSMSYNDLSAAAGGVRQVSLEEQLLRGVGAGFTDDAMLGDAATAQLLAAASMGSSDAEGFDALLAQALAASLQTAHMPPSRQHSTDQAQVADAQSQDAAAGSMPQADAFAADSMARNMAGHQQEMGGVDATCDVAASSERDQHSWSGSSATSSQQTNQLGHPACRTISLPINLAGFDCCVPGAVGHGVTAAAGSCGSNCAGCGVSTGLQQQQPGRQQQHSGTTHAWSEALPGSEAVPSGMRGTCSKMLVSLMRHSSSCATSAATSSKPPAGDIRHAADAPSTRTQQQGGKLARSQRHSRSCSHLPDAVGTVGGFSWVSSAGAGSPSVNQETADDAVGAAASVDLMLTQPRDPLRRRQEGRWGRRRIVGSGEQQGREKRE